MDSRPYQLPGARLVEGGVAFRLRSGRAEAVELCLYDALQAPQASGRWTMAPQPGGDWTVVIPDLQPGQLYGYRVHGPWEPGIGDRFSAAKLLVDPGAAAIAGDLHWHSTLADIDVDTGESVPSLVDTAPLVPKAVVVDSSFDWQDDAPPRVPWDETVIYECHLKGMTELHPDIPSELRGKFLGLCHPAILEHLAHLGVTAVELLPVQHFIPEGHLAHRGLTNYFGYNPIGWVAPHAGYASGDRGEQVHEFKTMVRTFHHAGLEVLLDVVFNHSAEGNHLGPVLSLRGIDNRGYYRLVDADPRFYENFSGCGNTLDFGGEAAIELTLAALRYWVEEMRVDGFRFDLATCLGRDPDRFDPRARFLERLAADPLLAQVKLIAEPWDVGPNGYQLGRFPPPWREWNDRYRDTVRGFWRGDGLPAGELVRRLGGSTDLLPKPKGARSASINFVTCHDGFTLEDLVSYEHRHNLANGEDNRDGHQHNLSANWGEEGPTTSPQVLDLRARAKRNFIATLAMSTGTPMISHGDELGRTQHGNNNAYCHDSPLTWVDWKLDPQADEFLRFVRLAFDLRRELLAGPDLTESWIASAGQSVEGNGFLASTRLPIGRFCRTTTRTSLTIVNGDLRGHLFELPSLGRDGHWRLLLNTDRPQQRRLRGHAVRVPPLTLLVLEFVPDSSR